MKETDLSQTGDLVTQKPLQENPPCSLICSYTYFLCAARCAPRTWRIRPRLCWRLVSSQTARKINKVRRCRGPDGADHYPGSRRSTSRVTSAHSGESGCKYNWRGFHYWDFSCHADVKWETRLRGFLTLPGKINWSSHISSLSEFQPEECVRTPSTQTALFHTVTDRRVKPSAELLLQSPLRPSSEKRSGETKNSIPDRHVCPRNGEGKDANGIGEFGFWTSTGDYSWRKMCVWLTLTPGKLKPDSDLKSRPQMLLKLLIG